MSRSTWRQSHRARAVPERASNLAVLDERHFYLDEGPADAPQLSLAQLFSAGVECGHAEARNELKRRVAVVDQQLEEFRAVRDQAQEHLAAELLSAQRTLLTMQIHTGYIETSLSAARHRIDELESSTTWQATAPIRAAGHRSKVLLARANARWTAIRRTPQLAAMIWSIFRNDGTRAVVRRAWSKLRGRTRYKVPRAAMFTLEEGISPLAFAESEATVAGAASAPLRIAVA